MDTKELETLDPLNYCPVDVNRCLIDPPFSVVHDQLLCLAHIEGEVVVLVPHCQFSDLFLIGCLIVVSKPNDGVGVVFATQSLLKQGNAHFTTIVQSVV